MLASRRIVYCGVVCLTLFIMCALIVGKSGIQASGERVAAPAGLDETVTISMSPDNTLTFITCAPYEPKLWQRLFSHSTLSAAFVLQHGGPMRNVVTHTGLAHIEFQGNLLRIAFADSSRFVFTTVGKGTIPETDGEVVVHAIGLATYRVAGLRTHASFVASRDWSKRACGL